jgi:hypothetical protein
MTEQHDVEEFFNILCQRLENKLKGTNHEKLLRLCSHSLLNFHGTLFPHQCFFGYSEHFGGTLSNEIFSTNPQYPYYSEREEDFYTIPLEVKNKSNLEEVTLTNTIHSKFESLNFAAFWFVH